MVGREPEVLRPTNTVHPFLKFASHIATPSSPLGEVAVDGLSDPQYNFAHLCYCYCACCERPRRSSLLVLLLALALALAAILIRIMLELFPHEASHGNKFHEALKVSRMKETTVGHFLRVNGVHFLPQPQNLYCGELAFIKRIYPRQTSR